MRNRPTSNRNRILALTAMSLIVAFFSCAEEWVRMEKRPGDFPLVQAGNCADIIYSPEDHKVVSIAAHDLVQDVERMSGSKPTLRTNLAAAGSNVVIVGTMEGSPLIQNLVKSGKLDVEELRGQWESFLITTISNPAPGINFGLVVVGSDRRGTAFGVYEISQAIGVSPWHWWADVKPVRKSSVFVASGSRRFGPPSVKYRGIFLNDEDWGLQPWAAKTFEPEAGDIGPKTYGKLFELLLRLKANTLWPAMHACTKPFNQNPQNARLAGDYAIIMGSSHAEPMLRNNVGEWTNEPSAFNYAINRDGVLKYWEQRVAANGRFENLYTLGMRGIHDSAMHGPKTTPERVKLLQQVFADQRALLAKHVNPAVEKVPQLFCAYKEVLDLYRAGLQVPDDVTIVWPDDNFGYIRNFASAVERQRGGGFGIYYHISYLGRPLSYLWLCTTPPALIWEEMHKAWEHGADRVWIVNVGDLKPAEIETEFFLQMAWDINRWRADNLSQFLQEWAAREIGDEHAKDVATVMAEYYRLNFQRKPEHLQWWMPGQPAVASPFTETERNDRLAAFGAIRKQVEHLRKTMSAPQRDAFFELVEYPVVGAALADERYFHGEQSSLAAAAGNAVAAREFAVQAASADQQLNELTRVYNEEIAGGKWRGFMRLEPADREWRSMRIEQWAVPQFPVRTNRPTAKFNVATPPPGFIGHLEREGLVSIEAEHFAGKVDGRGAGWLVVRGLGRTGDAVTISPSTMPGADDALVAKTPRLDYNVCFATAGEHPIQLHLLPTHPISGGKLRLAASLDEQAPQMITLDFKDGGADWAQGVMNNVRLASGRIQVSAPGVHTLRIYGTDAGVVLDKIVIDCGGLRESYLGPSETR